MRQLTLLFLVVVVSAVAAVGQYYVPRAYYTIDTEGHASLPVPLRRLRRSILPPYNPGSSANANANANARANGWGADANAHADANANANANSRDGYLPPAGSYGAANPAYLKNPY